MRDYRPTDTARFPWASSDATGAAATATGVTVKVYDEANLTELTTGITSSVDFDALTGLHMISLALATVGVLPGHTYSVCVAATVDGKTVRQWLGQFSVLAQGGDIVSRGQLSAGGAGTFTLPAGQLLGPKVGDAIRIVSGTGKGYRPILTYNSGTGVGTVSAWDTNPVANDYYEVVALPNPEVLAATDFADGFLTANKILDNAITAAKIADGAIDAATFAAGAINAAAIAAAAFTAAKFATDAIDANALKPDAVAEIQSGLATAAALATAQADVTAIKAAVDTEVASILADTTNIKTRLPAALVGAKMDSTGTFALAGGDITSIVTAVFAHAVESGLTFDGFCKLVAALWIGLTDDIEGAGSTFRSADILANVVQGTKVRITGARQLDGDRAGVTVDLT